MKHFLQQQFSREWQAQWKHMITTLDTSLRPLNSFEQAECIVDTAGKGNLNFTIVSSCTGQLDSQTVQAGLKYLPRLKLIEWIQELPLGR